MRLCEIQDPCGRPTYSILPSLSLSRRGIAEEEEEKKVHDGCCSFFFVGILRVLLFSLLVSHSALVWTFNRRDGGPPRE